jgi:hypothetical protein
LSRALSGLLAALVVGNTTAGYAATVFLDAVLAEVNGAIVTATDAAIGKGLGLFGLETSPASIQAADVQHLVDAWLIDSEAVRLQIAPSPPEIAEALEMVARRLGGIDVLRGWLNQAGLDEAWVRKLVEADLRWRRFIDVRFRAFVFVTDEDVTKAIGPGPHTKEAREKAISTLREEITGRELAAWLAEARSRAAVRTTGAEGPGLPPPFALPKRGDSPATTLP